MGENSRESVIFFNVKNSVRAVMDVTVCNCLFACKKEGMNGQG